MKHDPLWQISVTTTAEAEEAVVALLEGLFADPVSVYFDERTKKSHVSVYCPKRSDWNVTKRAAIVSGLKRLKAGGIKTGSGTISVNRLARENWAESWKKHFKPIAVGSALLLKPSWGRQRARTGQVEVVLDPGLSFGTGHHATTGFCLREIVAAVCDRRGRRSQSAAPAKSFLDIGTGSGILAIAAAKLGYAPVTAFDFDPESVRVARENARRNGGLGRIRFFQADLTRLPRRTAEKFDFICANLISPLLIAERLRIVSRLRPGGVLVLAGILKREFAGVRTVFERAGLRFLRGKSEREWRSGTFILEDG